MDYLKIEKYVLAIQRLASLDFTAKEVEKGNVFHLKNPDKIVSPLTGMDRQAWTDAALYLLKGAFSHVKTYESLMVFPKLPGKSYPWRPWYKNQIHIAHLEGICRTLFIASGLLKDNPELEINGLKVAEYYRRHISHFVDPTKKSYITPRKKDDWPSQQLVELGSLAITLSLIPEVLWEPLPQKTKDALQHLLLSYGDGSTVPNNWRFFNIFILSFFKKQGVKVNESLLEEYLRGVLADYNGGGWYNDKPAFDYYSMWSFQTYGSIWSHVYGDFFPDIANALLGNFKDIEDNYPNTFGKDGKMIMWGRSISYRMGAVAPFALTSVAGGVFNYGWLRRISSGTILQFLQHPEFMKDAVPTLGFYKPFEPSVQSYSCRGSVYWLGKVFLGLALPKNNPFWETTENNGPWETYNTNEVYNRFSEGSNILVTNYPEIGAAEIRSCVDYELNESKNPNLKDENYNRLAYNSVFPWQADGEDGTVAMNYRFLNKNNIWEPSVLYTFAGFKNEVYRRNMKLQSDEGIQLQLADVPLPNGILRLDRQQSDKPVQMRLGHYALPVLNGNFTVREQKVKGFTATILDNGSWQLAMVPVSGWENVAVKHATGLHPEASESAVINVSAHYRPGTDKTMYATLMLWKKAGEVWKEEELIPFSEFKFDEEKAQATLNVQGRISTVWF